MEESSAVANHECAPELGNELLVLIGDAVVLREKFKQAGFFRVNIDDFRIEGQRIAGEGHGVVGEFLLGVQNLGERDPYLVEPPISIWAINFEAE